MATAADFETHTAIDSDTEARVREHARILGVTDERAVAAALGRAAARPDGGLRDALGLLRSWRRHPASGPRAV